MKEDSVNTGQEHRGFPSSELRPTPELDAAPSFTPRPWTLETVPTQIGVCHKINMNTGRRFTYACLYDDCGVGAKRNHWDQELLANAELIVRAVNNYQEWQPIETAPKDGSAILLLSIPYEMDAGPNGVHQIPAKVAIGHWFAEGTSWVSEGPHPDNDVYLAKTGVWLSGGGWFQPDEVSHWQPLPPVPITQDGASASALSQTEPESLRSEPEKDFRAMSSNTGLVNDGWTRPDDLSRDEELKYFYRKDKPMNSSNAEQNPSGPALLSPHSALSGCPFCGEKPEVEPWHGGPPTKVMISCANLECDVSPQVTGDTLEVATNHWNTRAPADSSPINDAIRLYAALENLYGDLCLIGLAEISLESVYEGSARDALKLLKQLQRWRERNPRLAIGQAAEKLDVPA